MTAAQVAPPLSVMSNLSPVGPRAGWPSIAAPNDGVEKPISVSPAPPSSKMRAAHVLPPLLEL